MTLRISWSGLRRYEECHQRHLRFIQKKANIAKDARMYFPGTMADRLMKEFLDQDDPQPGWMESHVIDMFWRLTQPQTEEDKKEARPVKWRGDPAKDRREIIRFVTTVVKRLEPVLFEHIIPKGYHPALRFSTPVWIPFLDGKPAGVHLIGEFDVVTKDEQGQFHIYDLKATVNKDYVQKTLGQAIFYDIAFGHYIGDAAQPQAVSFIFPAIPELTLKTVRVSDDDREVMMSRIIRMAQGMWRKEWEPKENDRGCMVCEVKHVCDKFSIPHYVDESGKNRARFDAAG